MDTRGLSGIIKERIKYNLRNSDIDTDDISDDITEFYRRNRTGSAGAIPSGLSAPDRVRFPFKSISTLEIEYK